ncbi:AWPM-19-like membrane family protein [Musa troglodytarum]|uniref:AWPM-19-like membrane family protein n=1 Tax=Musa troglodytarum TaxID=320322 RepID=A0A9E7FJP7_9LILI|nr:AWPM-19-like membrane family protein [Musa troglodytarum]
MLPWPDKQGTKPGWQAPPPLYISSSSSSSSSGGSVIDPSITLIIFHLAMADEGMKSVASLLLLLNFCMYVIVASIGGWALNFAIDHGFTIGSGLALPAHFSPVYFPMGNQATGFFVIFALIAGVVGAAAAIAGIQHARRWNNDSLPSAASSAVIAWGLTLLAMGLACKEIHLEGRNTRLRTMEAFLIILSATQLVYILAIHGGLSGRR